jgi:hypothetical protein
MISRPLTPPTGQGGTATFPRKRPAQLRGTSVKASCYAVYRGTDWMPQFPGASPEQLVQCVTKRFRGNVSRNCVRRLHGHSLLPRRECGLAAGPGLLPDTS